MLRRDIRPTRSSRARASRTRSPRSPPAAARPTACCTSGARARGRRGTVDRRVRCDQRRTPLLCDLKPGGRYVAVDLCRAGGVACSPAAPEAGLLHEDAPTVTGRRSGEIAAGARETPGQKVDQAAVESDQGEGGLAILHGNLAPEGCVVKLAGHERRAPSRARPACSKVRRRRWPRSGRRDPRRGRGRDPQRGPGRGAWDARDARRDRGAHRPGLGDPWRSSPTGASPVRRTG